MKLKKIKINNIRSYSDEEISFPEGSTLLAGDIGSGKTSILLALEYALFGLQPGQRGSSLLSNKNDSGGVILEFEAGENKIIIERKLKRGNKSITQDYVSIDINGEKIESSITEIKIKILELLGYPLDFIKKNNLLYRYTVYTPQEEMKQIILEDAESRLDVLRHIFGVDKYKRIKENLSKIAMKLKENARVLQIECSNLDESKDKVSASVKFVGLLSGKIEEKNKELEKAVYSRKEVENDLDKIKDKIKEKENFQKEIEKTRIMLSSKIEQLSNEERFIAELEEKIKTKETFDEIIFDRIIEEIKNKKSKVKDLNSQYIDFSSKLDSLIRRREEDSDKKNRIFKIDICPTCLQDVPDSHKHNILNEVEGQIKKSESEERALISKKNEAILIIEKEKSHIEELEKERIKWEIIRAKQSEIKSAEEKIELVRKSKDSLKKDISFLESHVNTLKSSAFELMKYDNLITLKKDELKKSFGEEKRLEIELAELRKEVELTKYEIEQLEAKIKEAEKIKQKLIVTLEMEDWLSNNFANLVNFVETNILITLRQEFSRIFNKWFSMLTTDSFQVYLDESFSPIIMQGDFEIDYAFLSGGERTAVALAYRLALNQIINSLFSRIKTKDLVILDEPTDGFSDQQLDKIRDILQELNIAQLLIVSHEPKIEGFVDNIIRIKKDKGISFVEKTR